MSNWELELLSCDQIRYASENAVLSCRLLHSILSSRYLSLSMAECFAQICCHNEKLEEQLAAEEEGKRIRRRARNNAKRVWKLKRLQSKRSTSSPELETKMCNQPQTADNGIAIDTIIEKQIDEIAGGVHAKNRQDKMGGFYHIKVELLRLC